MIMDLCVLILVLLSTQQWKLGFVRCKNGPLQLHTINIGAGQYEPMTFKCFHSFEFTPSHSEVVAHPFVLRTTMSLPQAFPHLADAKPIEPSSSILPALLIVYFQECRSRKHTLYHALWYSRCYRYLLHSFWFPSLKYHRGQTVASRYSTT
jgi:hypothetical protein